MYQDTRSYMDTIYIIKYGLEKLLYQMCNVAGRRDMGEY